jgi:hypothetical protein
MVGASSSIPLAFIAGVKNMWSLASALTILSYNVLGTVILNSPHRI